ncbi:hypothetical protein GUJ93_ZPchr0004g39804 [Zizania palustris]|uniref:Uncharacterized protein n=1 Tax=Zizania palustris TaxID=103762 RepID=A0A8J5V8X5_ZIZPA|nr:hypothetical protein GUJ93_ZPchr0004g39804 [Zizania palustris]
MKGADAIEEKLQPTQPLEERVATLEVLVQNPVLQYPQTPLIPWILLHATKEGGSQGLSGGGVGSLGRAKSGDDGSVGDVNSAAEANATFLTTQSTPSRERMAAWLTVGGSTWMPLRHQQPSSRTSWFSRGEEMSWPQIMG